MFAKMGFRGPAGTAIDSPAEVWHALAEKLFESTLVMQPSQETQQLLLTIVRRLPLDTQRRWVELVKLRMVTPRNPKSCGSCGGIGDLILAIDTAQNAVCVNCGLTAMTPLQMIANPSLEDLRRSQHRAARKGEDCITTLNWSFGSIVSVADTITVIDPYCIVDAFRAEERARGSSGLFRMMLLASQSGVGEFRIYAGSGMRLQGKTIQPNEVHEFLRPALLRLPDTGMHVRLSVMNKGDSKDLMHDRWIGFAWSRGGQLSWSMGKGLGQYSGSRFAQNHAVSRQDDSIASTQASQLDRLAEIEILLR